MAAPGMFGLWLHLSCQRQTGWEILPSLSVEPGRPGASPGSVPQPAYVVWGQLSPLLGPGLLSHNEWRWGRKAVGQG